MSLEALLPDFEPWSLTPRVLIKVVLAHTLRDPTEVPYPGPDPFPRVVVDLPYPIAIIITGPPPPTRCVTDGRMLSLRLGEAVIPAPFIGIHRRTRRRRLFDQGSQGRLVRMVHYLQPHLTRSTTHNPDDRRTVVLLGPMPSPLVRTPPGWIVRIGMRNAFLARILVHLIGFHLVIVQRCPSRAGLGLGLHPTP